MKRIIGKAREKSRLILEYVLIGTVVTLCCATYKLFQDRQEIQEKLAISEQRIVTLELENDQQGFKISALEQDCRDSR